MQVVERKMTTAERNAWFETLSPREQRIQLAKDVLASLDEELLVANVGYYFKRIPELEEVADLNFQAALQELAEREVPCEVCARGALFACRVRGYDHFREDQTVAEVLNARSRKPVEAVRDTETNEALAGIFSKPQLDLIENTFEAYLVNRPECLEVELLEERDVSRCAGIEAYYEAARTFRGEEDGEIIPLRLEPEAFLASADERLRRIMENILANDGIFLVPGHEDTCRRLALLDNELSAEAVA